MPYAAVADFVLAFGEQEAIALSTLDNPESLTVDDAVIERGLRDAEAMIDGYLQSGGYVLPLSSAPTVIVRATCDIARYWLDRIRAREDVRMRYEDWMKWLKDVAKGLVDLGVGSGGEPVTVSGSDEVEFFTEERVFTRSSLLDW